jgi:hypothetical protein
MGERALFAFGGAAEAVKGGADLATENRQPAELPVERRPGLGGLQRGLGLGGGLVEVGRVFAGVDVRDLAGDGVLGQKRPLGGQGLQRL